MWDVSFYVEAFNFTMLTVDTHFTDGYVCDLCEDVYEAQYSNVIACSSQQIAEFVDWIKTQDFYEDTTIIIAGDHLTMDSTYISEGDRLGLGVNLFSDVPTLYEQYGEEYLNGVLKNLDLRHIAWCF